MTAKINMILIALALLTVAAGIALQFLELRQLGGF